MNDRNDRSDRLRKRLDDEPDERSEPDEPAPDDSPAAGDDEQPSTSSSEPSKSSKSSQTDMPAETPLPKAEAAAVKDRPSVLMYLPADLRQEMDIRFDEVNATAKREFGDGLEKNRHWYPLLLSLALEKTDEMAVDELLSRLDEAEY